MRIRSLTQEKITSNQEYYRLVYELWKEGKTLREIGEQFGVTKQRAWQIVDRMKEGNGDYYYKHRNKVAS
jgi:DNA-directed RNA polymerase sigma subunit (sigma70/sigma32)|tara:strand:- start:47 stop:256 length:210 start_codon:yes stop_codon:yes gene_type:complete